MMLAFVPILLFLVGVGLAVYAIQLAIRLVNAVEQIARTIAALPPDRPPL